MTRTLKFCLVCGAELPLGSAKKRKFCNATCRNRATWRRQHGKPIADLPATAAELLTLTQQLADARKETSRAQKQLAKAHAKNHALKSQLQSAKTALQALENASATQIAKAYQLAQEENEQLRQDNEQLANELAKLHAVGQQLEQAQEDSKGAERYARKLRASYGTLFERWFTQAQRLSVVARDLLFYAPYYYRATEQSTWSQEDYERHSRYQQLKAHPPQRPRRK
ncbi:hypothetical protein [Rothia sp. P4278]|uniref:hypothetical protein n=1 Tax=Rothia sp. P4278 TaxID=3402658 RepID=UPI003AEE13F0